MKSAERWQRTLPAGDGEVSLRLSVDRLNLYLPELRGKRILDIGSGVIMPFATSAFLEGINVVSLDPRAAYMPVLGLPTPFVAGEATRLPFKNGVFGLVVSQYMIPMWLDLSKEDIKEAFREVDRVLIPGGEARFYPVHNNLFWYEFRRQPTEFPEEIADKSDEYKFAYITFKGLKDLGIQNISLEERRVIRFYEGISQPVLLVYRKPNI